MPSDLARVPEAEVMGGDEETAYIANNSVVFGGTHPMVAMFRNLCPAFGEGAARILDIGCGVANMPIEFARAYPAAHVVGVDASENMLRHATMMVEWQGMGDRISLRRALLPDEGFGEPEHSFDLVFARSTLHHFRDPAAFWGTVARYAKDDAAIFVIDLLRPPSLAHLELRVWERFADQMSALRSAFQMSLLASHTPEEIGAQLRAVGLVAAVSEFPDEWRTHVAVWRPGKFGGPP